MKHGNQRVYSYKAVRHPALLEVCNNADQKIYNLKRRFRIYRFTGLILGVISVLLSVALAQKLVLEETEILSSLQVAIIGYSLAVTIGIDKLLSFDTKAKVIKHAENIIYNARQSAFTKEKAEITRRGGKPVGSAFAGNLVDEIAKAQEIAEVVLQQI